MASLSSKVKKGSKMLIHRVDCKAPTFKLSLEIVETLDPIGAQSQVFPKVLLVHDIHCFYHCSIQELETLEMNQAFNELCINGVLKLEHKHLETKGLMHILHISKDFQVKRIRFILSCFHNR